MCGIGRGLIGFALSPIVGVVDAGSALMNSAKKAIDGDDFVLERKRTARVFVWKRITQFYQNPSVCQFKFQNTRGFATDHFVYFERNMNTRRGFALSTTALVIIEEDMEFSFLELYDNIDVKIARRNTLVVYKNKQEKTSFNFQEQDTLRKVFFFIHSRQQKPIGESDYKSLSSPFN